MKYTRLYADQDGETHFEDVEIGLTAIAYAPPAPALLIGDAIAAKHCVFMTMPVGWVGDWHPTPRRQFFLQLSGEIESEVTDGEVRRFLPGSIHLLDDANSKGHVTRSVGAEDVTGAFVQLPE